jgi:hypothetical protein
MNLEQYHKCAVHLEILNFSNRPVLNVQNTRKRDCRHRLTFKVRLANVHQVRGVIRDYIQYPLFKMDKLARHVVRQLTSPKEPNSSGVSPNELE